MLFLEMIRIEKRQNQKLSSRSKAESKATDRSVRPTRAMQREVGPSARWTAEGGCPHIWLSLHELELFRWEDDFGVEEGAGYSGGDGEQFPLSGEDFDLAGTGKFWKVDGTAAADAGDGGFVGGDGGKLRKELAGVDEEGL